MALDWRPVGLAMIRRCDWPMWLLVGCVVIALFMAAMCKASRAHGPAQWIQDGNYKNAVGQLCCGERDCAEIASDDVKITVSGYYIVSLRETVPFNEATPSPTGTYWRCAWGGERKCFFAPPGQS